MQLPDLEDFLLVATSSAWLEAALENVPILLIDHAHCEKKAAATALNLIYRYPTLTTLIDKLSKLAREELRHFEQVLSLMNKLDIIFDKLEPSRYAKGLRQFIRHHEPARLVDTLLVCAFIEARSAERFLALTPHLISPLQGFYQRLLQSERRHFQLYLSFAYELAQEDITPRIALFAKQESELIATPDKEFRFHSGRPFIHTQQNDSQIATVS